MRTITLLKILMTALLGATFMSAQTNRTWVSGQGNDANPCSLAAPCKTFATALSKTAPGGEIDALDAGSFGAVVITKAVTIDGGRGNLASVPVNGTNSIVVAAQADDVVTLRNLSIDGIVSSESGGLSGITWTSGKALYVENCNIFGFNNSGIEIAKSDGGQAFIIDTIATNNGGSGIKSQNTTGNVAVTINHSRFEQNQFGIFASDFSRFSVTDSDASGNTNTGFIANASAGTAEINIASSTAANNSNSGILAGGGTTASNIVLTGVAIHGNASFGLFVGGNGSIVTFNNTPNFNTDPVSGTPTSVAPL